MLCPRREELGNSSVFNLPEKDEWQERDGHRCCSYCGSYHPDDFMARVEEGVEIVPTDKSYKAYIKLPHPDPDGQRIVGRANHEVEGYEKIGEREFVKYGRNGDTVQAKFYYQHLSDEQKHRFVQLLNEGKIKIGYPGHFYVRPFFITVGKQEAE